MINIDGVEYRLFNYKHFIIENLSEFGCAIFESEIELPEIRNLMLQNDELKSVKILKLNFLDTDSKDIKGFYVIVNKQKDNLFPFFNNVKLFFNHHGIAHSFYGCDFVSDKIFYIDQYKTKEEGKLIRLLEILGIEDYNSLIVRFLPPMVRLPEYDYFLHKVAFRDKIEQDFEAYKQTLGEKYLDTYYSESEIEDKFDKESNAYIFDRDVILEFDIDNAGVSLYSRTLKARNLNVKNIFAQGEKVFANDIRCESIVCDNVLAKKIACKQLQVKKIKTCYENGLELL